MIVYHFANTTMRDGSPLPTRGERLPTITNPVPCERGYHGSERAIDALLYAPGCMVSRRDLSGIVLPHGDPVDKYVGAECTMATGYVDATATIVHFARWCALRALREDAPKALRATGYASLIAHADTLSALPDDCDLMAASWAASSAALRATSLDALRATSSAASRAASWAEAASWAADASRTASRAAQNTYLEKILEKLWSIT